MSVPCNGCTLCCHGDAIRLLPEDNPDKYKTVPHHAIKGALMIDHKPNGDCIYLSATGCAIHDDKPKMCRYMDCRNIAAKISFTTARKLANKNLLPFNVWRRGKDLLKAKK